MVAGRVDPRLEPCALARARETRPARRSAHRRVSALDAAVGRRADRRQRVEIGAHPVGIDGSIATFDEAAAAGAPTKSPPSTITSPRLIVVTGNRGA